MQRQILLVITDLEIGGTPTVVRELATRLRSDDVHIEVVSLKSIGPVGEELIARDVDVTAMNAKGVSSLPAAIRELRRVIADRRIDTVVSFLIHANFVSSLAVPEGVRLFQSIQTTQPRPAWHWWLQGWIATRAEKFIVPSKSVADVAHARANIALDRFEVVPNAIDPGEFQIKSSSAGRSVGFIGRLDPIKRIPDLIDAMRSLPGDTTLHIFGEGADDGRIEAKISGAGLRGRVMLHGAVARPQIALEKIDVLVLPSEAEGFGLVLIEAMAAGVPVVATNVPGIRDVVRNETDGLLVPAGDPVAISRAIGRLMDDPQLRSRLIVEGLKTVRRRYAWDAVLPKYHALLGIG